MSNFNLVSDENNGHNYTCYFGEDIVIEPNSKVYLNFASLLREGREQLVDDATVTISSTALLPRKIIVGGVAVDNTITASQTIEAGSYTNLELEQKIRDAIEAIVTTGAGEKLQYYTSSPDEPSNTGAGLVAVSLALNTGTFRITDPDFALDPANQFNSSTGSGGTASYEKTDGVIATDRLAFDNYAVDDTVSWHYSYDTTKLAEYPSAMTFGFDTRSPGSLLMAIYGNEYPDLANPSAGPNPMTNGLVRPTMLTVDQPAEEVDPALGFSNSFVLTELGGKSIIDVRSATTIHSGFRITVSSASSSANAVCYPFVDALDSVANGVARINRTNITGSITGLAVSTPTVLTEQSTSGLGGGFSLRATSSVAGVVSSVEILADGEIVDPGALGSYAVGDTIILEELTTPGVGTVTVTVTAITNFGEVSGYVWVNDSPTYRTSDMDGTTTALSMGAGFAGEDDLTVVQGVTASTDTRLSDNATSACFGVPATFLSVIKRGSQSQPDSTNGLGSTYEIYFAKDSGGNFIGKTGSGNTDWASQDVAIARMEKIGQFRATLSRGFQTLAIKPYYDTSIRSDYEGNTKKLFFKIIDITATTDIELPVVLFDSKITGHYFPFSFFTGITPTTQAEVDLQIPFKIMLSAQAKDAGFQSVESEKYVADPVGGGQVGSICEKATISFSPNLANILSSTTAPVVFPTSDPDDPLTFSLLDATLFWRNKSYYVTIDEMPLSNYKNRRTVTQAGTGRIQKGKMLPILANIPLPFESVASALKDEDLQGSLVGSVYEPPKKVISTLLNQRISTNRLSVKVFRMDSDVLADEIKQSIINFTIIKDEPEDI